MERPLIKALWLLLLLVVGIGICGCKSEEPPAQAQPAPKDLPPGQQFGYPPPGKTNGK